MSTIEQTGLTTGHTDNSILIDAPLDHVWRMTNDLRSWPELFTEYSEVEVLSETASTFRFRLKMHPDEPGRFEFMDIRWSYAPEGSGTRMRWVQDFRMRPEAPIDTAGMTQRIDANSKVQMSIIKEKVEAAAA